MLRSLVSFSLKYRGVVVVLSCVFLAYGIYVTTHAKLDVFPNFVQPQVEIQTECPGLAPEQVELLVTLPLERTVSGLGDMESLRSESIEGLSVITAVFKEGTDVFRARQVLSENLAETATELPAFVKPPRMTPLTSSTMDLLKIGLVTDQMNPMELRTFADWTLRPRLLAVPGVAKCSVYGGDVRQFQIQVIPERLVAYGLGISDVLAAARAATAVLGAGFIETTNQRITLQTEGQALTAEALGQTPIVNTNHFSVRLSDVAHVVAGTEPKFGGALIQGRWGVLLTMSSQYGANTMEVTRRLEAALEEMNPVLERNGIKLYGRLHRPATFIEVALTNMNHSLALGAILVAVVLFLMLGSVRSACISLTAIPLSLLAAVVALDKCGITLNTITLGGLAIALGEVVDDSIIDVENIYRRLREFYAGKAAATTEPGAAQKKRNFREALGVVLNASLEIRSAVVYATFVVALVFAPVLTLTGLQGSFYAPLALSYILAIMASLLVALTLTPALSYIFFGRSARTQKDPMFQRWLKAGYLRLLGWVARWPRAVMGVVALVCALAIWKLPMLSGDFLPDFREGHFVVQVFLAPGTSLPETLRLGRQISLELLGNTNIATISQQAGRAELGEDPWGPQRCEFHIELQPVPGEEEEKIQNEIDDVLKKFPGIQYNVTTFLGDRIGETIAGEVSPVVVSIFGEDLGVLEAKAAEVARVLNAVPGHRDVKASALGNGPRLVIRLRPERLTPFGYRAADLLEEIQTAYEGIIVAQTHEGSRVTDVAVILDPQSRQDPESVGGLMVRNASGVRLPLRELADIFLSSGPFSISHEGARRRQVVTCSTTGRDVSSFVEEARRQVAEKIKFPAGTYAVFSGAAEAKEKADRELLLHSGIAAVGILLLLTMVFHNWRNFLLVLANVPFALVGGVLAVWLTGVLAGEHEGGLTIGSLVGFVTLFGITTRNSIMMISHFEHLVTREGVAWGPEAVMRGAAERLLPILMTATVTALGLLPLALGSGEAGREIEGPMAIVILGGLITSTALNLLVLPTLALRYGKFESPEADAK